MGGMRAGWVGKTRNGAQDHARVARVRVEEVDEGKQGRGREMGC